MATRYTCRQCDMGRGLASPDTYVPHVPMSPFGLRGGVTFGCQRVNMYACPTFPWPALRLTLRLLPATKLGRSRLHSNPAGQGAGRHRQQVWRQVANCMAQCFQEHVQLLLLNVIKISSKTNCHTHCYCKSPANDELIFYCQPCRLQFNSESGSLTEAG